MNSIIDQQRDKEEFMYCIDPIAYWYLYGHIIYMKNLEFKTYNQFQEISLNPEEVLRQEVNNGRLTLSKYLKLISRK
jgi:hypothetical protein